MESSTDKKEKQQRQKISQSKHYKRLHLRSHLPQKEADWENRLPGPLRFRTVSAPESCITNESEREQRLEGIICISSNRTVSWKNSCAFPFFFLCLKTRFHKSKGGRAEIFLLPSWQMVGPPFTTLSSLFPQTASLNKMKTFTTRPEYILPAQVHKLNSHSAPQSNSVWVENMDLHIYFALTRVQLNSCKHFFLKNRESMPNYLYFLLNNLQMIFK